MELRLARIELQLEKINEKLSDFRTILMVQENTLNEHMLRTDIAEKRQDDYEIALALLEKSVESAKLEMIPVQKAVNALNLGVKLLLPLGTILSTVAAHAVLKVIGL